MPQASVAFTPLQGLFGIITPSGLHFERHHQGWVEIDPSRHRLMINGLVKTPKVYTMDDLMRLPQVSRTAVRGWHTTLAACRTLLPLNCDHPLETAVACQRG